MADLTDFFGSGGGGGLTPKFQEFNSSGTFTPSAGLIAAGGYIEVFLVAGGGRPSASWRGGSGGETIIKKMYLTSVSSCSVNIGAGGAANGSNGGSSSFLGSTAGGVDITASGGRQDGYISNQLGAGHAAFRDGGNAGSGILGYGTGGRHNESYGGGGVISAKPNSGQGCGINSAAGSGYCLIKWYE